jgi:hypothetical protein
MIRVDRAPIRMISAPPLPAGRLRRGAGPTPFVRDRHGEVVGDPAGHRHVAPVVGVALLRPEREDNNFMPHARRDAEDGAVPARDEPRGRIDPADHRQRLAGEVTDDEVLRHRRPQHERLHGGKIGRCRRDAHLPVRSGAPAIAHRAGASCSQSRDLRQHRSDVRHVRDGAQHRNPSK